MKKKKKTNIENVFYCTIDYGALIKCTPLLFARQQSKPILFVIIVIPSLLIPSISLFIIIVKWNFGN